ncbi:hypothetical protein K1719_002709 [Acacia pycnantha]|nr:hypothetical protein K1719_002709 [Acacia pycnantha]
MGTNKKRKREIQEENKGNEITRYDQETFTLRELYLIQQLLLPREMNKIDDIEWNRHHIKLVIEKKLCQNDVGQRGFVIPEYQILEDARDFLKHNEVQHMKNNMRTITVKLLNQNLEEYKLNLMWREIDSYYNLTGGWLNIVRDNNLKLDEKVQLWSFRRDGDELGFALFKLTQ